MYRNVVDEPGGRRSVVLQDDDGAAWATLFDEGVEVCAVWLYDGTGPERALSQNTKERSREAPVVPRLTRVAVRRLKTSPHFPSAVARFP